jgi:hypothetical protein
MKTRYEKHQVAQPTRARGWTASGQAIAHVPDHARTRRVGPIKTLPGYGAKNATVAAVRFAWPRPEMKQTGRRYGPPPKRTPGPTRSAPAPLGSLVRMLGYVDQNDAGFTARQDRQWKRMKAREFHGRKAENRARRGSVTA